MHKKTSLKGKIAAVMILAILVIFISLLLERFNGFGRGSSTATTTQVTAQLIRDAKAPIPQLSEATKRKLAASKGFQVLASYTNQGFEPTRIGIKKGNTVRFTNNSDKSIWIASGGTKLYPQARSGGCGSSGLDSCEAFPPQDFWEFTFDTPGEWKVINNLDKSKSILVVVE